MSHSGGEEHSRSSLCGGTSEREKPWRSKWNQLTEAKKQQRRLQRAESMRKLRQLHKDRAAARAESHISCVDIGDVLPHVGNTMQDVNETNSGMLQSTIHHIVAPASDARGIISSNAHIQEWLASIDNERGCAQGDPSSAIGGWDTAIHVGEAASHIATYPHLQSVDSLFAYTHNVADVEWTRNLFKWFVGGHERTHRYAAYVFGVGGEGKTRVARAMVRGMRVFECRLTEPYAFEGFDESTDILLLDDVNWNCFDIALRSTLLSIMARQPTTIQRKHKPQTTVLNDKVLTIFTSNFKLPTDTAFRRRTYIVWAKMKACNDAIAASEDDPGDDDTDYVNPKPVASVPGVRPFR
jgi:hypothetical protein